MSEILTLILQRAGTIFQSNAKLGLSLDGRRNGARIFDDPLLANGLLAQIIDGCDDPVMLEHAFPAVATVSKELQRIAEETAVARAELRREIELQGDSPRVQELKDRREVLDRRRFQIESWFPSYRLGGRAPAIEAAREAIAEVSAKVERIRAVEGPRSNIMPILPLLDRKVAVKSWQQSRPGGTKASLYKQARVDKSDYYRWERGELADGSTVDSNIRRVLTT